MSVTILTTNKKWKLYKVHSNHSCFSFREADDSAQRDYNQPIHSQKVIPDYYDREHDDNE